MCGRILIASGSPAATIVLLTSFTTQTLDCYRQVLPPDSQASLTVSEELFDSELCQDERIGNARNHLIIHTISVLCIYLEQTAVSHFNFLSYSLRNLWMKNASLILCIFCPIAILLSQSYFRLNLRITPFFQGFYTHTEILLSNSESF